MKAKKLAPLLVLALIAVALAYMGGLFSVIPQEREIGRTEVYTNSVNKVSCPTSYNNLQVDFCDFVALSGYRFPYRPGFCPTSTGCNSGWYSAPCSSGFATPEACMDWLNQYSQSSQGCSAVASCGGTPGKFTGEIYISNVGYEGQTLGAYMVYYENFIQCNDGSYNYRSSCPEPTICPDGSTVYAPNTCPITVYPPQPPVPIWTQIWNSFVSWIAELFKNVNFFSITGAQTVSPGSVNSYVISLAAPYPTDSNFADGSYNYRYANWVLTDKNGVIKQQGTWESVNNIYEKTVSITAPASPGDYAIISAIYEYNYTWNIAQNKWDIDAGTVIAREGINVASKVVVIPQPPIALPDFGKIITDMISGFFNWFKTLFGG